MGEMDRGIAEFIRELPGLETLFIVSAVLGLCNSAYAATIKTGRA